MSDVDKPKEEWLRGLFLEIVALEIEKSEVAERIRFKYSLADKRNRRRLMKLGWDLDNPRSPFCPSCAKRQKVAANE